MATISRFAAIAQIGPIKVWGFAGWVMWLAVHLFALTGFKNRIAVLSSWTIAFLGRGRSERVITAQQVVARQTLLGQQPTISLTNGSGRRAEQRGDRQAT